MTTATMETEAEVQARRKTYLGGSDVAAIMGKSRWKTALQVWGEKTGAIVPEDRSDELAIEVGKALEDTVAYLFTKRTGKALMAAPAVVRHPKYPFIGAQCDRFLVNEDAGFEAKTASGWKAAEWDGEDIPEEYLFQCYQGMAVTGKRTWYIACLIGGNQGFVWKKVDWDDTIIANIIERQVDFWERFVLTGEMPAVTSQDAETLFDLFPNSDADASVDLGEDGAKLVASIKQLQADVEDKEDHIERLRNDLKARIGNASLGVAGLYKVTWKNQASTRIDTERVRAEAPELYEKFGKTTESRVLRITENKPKKAK